MADPAGPSRRARGAPELRAGIRASLPSGTTRKTVEVLGRRIANGTYCAGEVIPKEDQLAASLGVSRTTVRDAIKVLSGKSLLQTARRYGTRVRPVSEWNLLDPDVLGWHAPEHPRFRTIFAEAMEMRRMIEPEAAALAAVRANAAQRRAIVEAARCFAPAQGSVHLLFHADCRFHVAIIEATGNLLMRQLSPVLVSMIEIAYDCGAHRLHYGTAADEPHVAAAAAIRDGDAAAARRLMSAMLYPDLRDHDS